MFENISTIRELLSTISEHYGEKTAFSYLKDGKTRAVSYAEFARQVNAAAKSLIHRGIANRTISIVSENSYDAMMWTYAVPLSGNVLVMLDNLTTIQDKAYLVAHSDTSCLIYSASNQPFRDYLSQNNQRVTDAICIETDTEDYIHTESNASLPDMDGREMSYIFYSSGTTSRPKGIMQSQINLLRSALYFSYSLIVENTVYLMLPLSHIFPFVNVVLASLYSGVNVFISAGLRHVLMEMREAKPHCIYAVPAVLSFFDKTISAAAQDIIKKNDSMDHLSARKMAAGELFGGNLSIIPTGGAPINVDVAKRMQDLDILVLNGYGLTETCGSITANPNNANRLGSVGRVNTNAEAKVIEGELALKSPYLFMGYYKDPEGTRQVFEGEWFLSGDLGYIKDDYVYITGRKKNVIVLPNGKNISPEEIEEEMLAIEEIKEVVICEQNGKLTAKVYTEHDEETVRKKIYEINKRLSSYKQIEHVVFYTEEFPKTSSKKIKRGEM